MIRACLFLLAGVYALQLNHAAGLLVLLVVAAVAGPRSLACFGIGAALFYIAAVAVIESRIAADYVGDSIVTIVRVADFPAQRGPTTSFVGEVHDNPWVPRRIRVSWFAADPAPEFGDVWRLELRLRRPRGTSNPGVFDYETWLFRERIAATAYVVESHRNQILAANDLNALDRLRRFAVRNIAATIDNPQRAAVLMAITVGARHAMTTEQWERYARTGTSHLMAISGLHVGLAAAGGYMLVLIVSGVVLRHRCQRQLATVGGLLVALLYALISGLAVPAQRATLMIGLGAVALLARREVQPFVVIALACIVVTSLNPLATMAPGFKLSFLAVLVLLLLARRWRLRLSLVAAQLHLFCGLLPLIVVIFARLSIAAPAVNLIAVPVFSLITVPFALAGLFAGDWSLHVAAASLDWIENGLSLVAAHDLASIEIPTLSGAACALLLVPLTWVLLPRAWPGRLVAWLGVLGIAGYSPAAPPPGCVAIDVLDVGQGLAIVAATAQQTTIYDTGPVYRGGGSAAESVLLPFLARRDIRSANTIIVTHADLDHAGGFAALRAHSPDAEIIVGETLPHHPHTRTCVAGQGWQADGVQFEFLWPRDDVDRLGNNASCVLQITAGAHRVLLTGDIESIAEHELVQSGQLEPVAVAVVPHHGSSTSSTPSFVTRLRAEYAIVSVGFANRWDLPDEDVVRRWQTTGARIVSTADSGAIGLRLCEHTSEVSIRKEREQRRRLWHE